MKIGVDFGTTYTKIAYLDEHGRPKLFEYPPRASNPKRYVPTTVAYQKHPNGENFFSIGTKAIQDRLHSRQNIIFCKNFKMFLPLKLQEEWEEQSWPLDAPEPAQVVTDYLQYLLSNGEQSFQKEVGKMTSLVVSVPEIWQAKQDNPGNPGAEQLRQIIKERLKLPLDHLQSEPVCAAAYYAYEHQRRADRKLKRNLLVCDMGGGTFDVALCKVDGANIEVLYFDGNGDPKQSLAGVAFDEAAVKSVWRSTHQQEPDLSDRTFLNLLREFEETKIQNSDGWPLKIYKHQDEKFKKTTPIYTLSVNNTYYDFMYDHIHEAFTPIEQGIRSVLQRVQDKANQNGYAIDLIAIVGGFGQYCLVRNTILEFFKITEDDVRFDPNIGSHHGAIAFGAALIAKGTVTITEPYPHTIGVYAWREDSIEQTTAREPVPIIYANKVPKGGDKIYFSENEHGERRIFIIKRELATHLPVFIQRLGEGERFELRVKETQYPKPGDYYIGVTIDRSNLVTLIFEPIAGEDSSKKKTYDLGEIDMGIMVK